MVWAEVSYKNREKWAADFLSIGEPDIFEADDLVDRLLDVYLGMMVNGGWAGAPLSKEGEYGLDAVPSLVDFYSQGLWMTCSSRVAFNDQIDIVNDGLPNYAAVPVINDSDISFIMARRLTVKPKRWAAPFSPFAYYQTTEMLTPPSQQVADRGLKRRWGDKISEHKMIINSLVAVSAKGNLAPCVGPRGKLDARWNGHTAVACATALGTISDFRHLWTVETKESVMASYIETPLRLGVTSEQVKSLFYAREQPLTPRGRKRPILHWVEAHRRRIAGGIDVDIRKYLRGITSFEMGGFGFNISSPIKELIHA